MTTGQENDKERASIHDALGHNRRIAILRALSEGPLGFADLKRLLNIDSGGTLQHHLLKMNGLIKNELGNYCLSEKGREALLTFQPMEKYNEDARFREQAGLLIRALRSDLKSVQEIAIVQLSLFGPKAVPYLKSALSGALDEIKTKEEKSQRSYWDSSSKKEATERAVTSLTVALGIIGVPSVVSDIAQALPRTEAFEALAKIGNKQALDAIVLALPTWLPQNVRYWDSEDYEHKEEATQETEKVDNFFRKIFNSFDEEGRIALETALANSNFVGKNVIARTLAVVGDDKSIPSLVSSLEKDDISTKTEVAKALARLEAKEAVPKIIDELFKTTSLLQSTRENNQYSEDYYKVQKTSVSLANAVLSLGSAEDWITIAFHRPRIEYAESFDKAIIASKEKAVPALTSLLQAPDSSAQIAAAEMIAKIKRGDNNDRSRY